MFSRIYLLRFFLWLQIWMLFLIFQKKNEWVKKFFSFFVSKFLRLHESATAGRPLISYSPHTVLLSSSCPFDFRSSKHSHRVTLLTLKHQDIRKLKFTKMTNDHYDVGKILDKRLYCDQVQYKIQWKNYSSTCSEWVFTHLKTTVAAPN